MYAPVILFVYNRLDHTRQTLQALDRNKDADKSELFIFSDAPADETEREPVRRVREYIEQYSHNSNFRKVEIYRAETNKGLAVALIDGITRIINQYGKTIVLEDDQVTSPDFIIFMNRALRYYEDDNKIWSIAGFSPDLHILRHYRKDIYIGYRANCWGWATWADRWNRVDWEVKDYEQFIKDRRAQKKFNRGGMDMTSLLKLQHEGKINSWAIRWCYQQYKENMLTIFPKYSKVRNSGLDGSGTNCGNTGNIFCVKFREEKDWDFRYNEKDDRVARKLSNYYSALYIWQKLGGFWYSFTEYEYCLAYRYNIEGGREKTIFIPKAGPDQENIKDKSEYRVIKPDFKRWYSTPVPMYYNKKYYVLMTVFDKWKRKSSVGISALRSDKSLEKPTIIIEEAFSMSLPSTVLYKGQVYMIQGCCEASQIRIYKMEEGNVKKWSLYYIFEGMKNMTDIAVCVDKDSKLYFLASEMNKKNPNQARLALFEVTNIENREKIKIHLLSVQEDYSYSVRNGGNFIEKDNIFRIVQHSTKEVYGKFITINQVNQLGKEGIQEDVIKKIGISDIPISLPQYIYRIWGTHTWGCIGALETADLLVQRFSFGGLLMKLCRKIKSVWQK